jgi:MacB-like protein
MDIRRLRGWLARLFSIFNRRRRDLEFAEELESHLATHIEDNLRAGMSPEEARRVALLKLGGVTLTRELHREQRGVPMLETYWQDLRFGLRMLRKNTGFSLFFHQLLERVNAMPGVTNAGAIVALPLTGIDNAWDIGLVTESQANMSLQQAPRISLGIITPQYFRAMEIPLLTGRAFDGADTQATPKVAIIDERLVRAHWPNASPLGQRIRIGQADDRADWHTIVGIAGAAQHDQPDVATRPTCDEGRPVNCAPL